MFLEVRGLGPARRFVESQDEHAAALRHLWTLEMHHGVSWDGWLPVQVTPRWEADTAQAARDTAADQQSRDVTTDGDALTVHAGHGTVPLPLASRVTYNQRGAAPDPRGRREGPLDRGSRRRMGVDCGRRRAVAAHPVRLGPSRRQGERARPPARRRLLRPSASAPHRAHLPRAEHLPTGLRRPGKADLRHGDAPQPAQWHRARLRDRASQTDRPRAVQPR